MRIVVMADSHGGVNAVTKIVERNIYTADAFIHLGDGENDTAGVLQEYPQIKLYQVRGNCDPSDAFPFMQVIDTVIGPNEKMVRILAVHGHLQGVERGTDELVRLAHENDCEIVLFAHTHKRFDATEDGVLLINPGSCARPRDDEPPSYAYVDITEWGTITGIVDLIE